MLLYIYATAGGRIAVICVPGGPGWECKRDLTEGCPCLQPTKLRHQSIATAYGTGLARWMTQIVDLCGIS